MALHEDWTEVGEQSGYTILAKGNRRCLKDKETGTINHEYEVMEDGATRSLRPFYETPELARERHARAGREVRTTRVR